MLKLNLRIPLLEERQESKEFKFAKKPIALCVTKYLEDDSCPTDPWFGVLVLCWTPGGNSVDMGIGFQSPEEFTQLKAMVLFYF